MSTDPSAKPPARAKSLRPAHPERICWGCPKYCPADDLGCANGSIRTMHPIELFGDDWQEWETEPMPDDPSDRQR